MKAYTNQQVEGTLMNTLLPVVSLVIGLTSMVIGLVSLMIQLVDRNRK